MKTVSTVLPGGTILLGSKVSCDGFAFNRPTGVITHVHGDHIDDFGRSLGMQDPILMLEPTKDLLYAIKGKQSLQIRRNLVGVKAGEPYVAHRERITLFSANHILGSAQVLVESEDGRRFGYTGDFRWPTHTMQGLDELVIDATYGSPEYLRAYKEEEVVEDFTLLVRQLLGEGRRICIKAVAGRLQYAMQLLQPQINVPFLASNKQAAIADVYHEYGLLADRCIRRDSEKGQEIRADKSRQFLAFHHLAEQVTESDYDVFVVVSAFMVSREVPITQSGPRTFRVALTDHADFLGTMLYVSQARPKTVIVDGSRAGEPETLAAEIRDQLGIPVIVAR